MEYMVSETAVLTTSLPGMPEEYKQYVYLIENETADGVCKAIKKISELSEEDIISKGRLAREFVLSKKNNKMQTNRIIELITANC